MRNKVEILRSIEFSVEDLSSILNLEEIASFSDKEKEFMEEFKKIYELGLNQLELFINKIDEEGDELDEYSIQYYVSQVLTGPLGAYARILSEGKKYFKSTPAILGTFGNVEKTTQNTAIIEKTTYPLGVNVDTYNKIPKFLQIQTVEASSKTEDLFRSSMKSSIFMDNTLQLADKNPQLRYDTEASGEWQTKAHGSYCVRDVGFAGVLSDANVPVFEKVKEYLGESDYRIFLDKKLYNPFDSDLNDSTSSNYTIIKELKEYDEITQNVELDILGDMNDSFERRESVLKIENPDKNVEYILNSNQGQLGIK